MPDPASRGPDLPSTGRLVAVSALHAAPPCRRGLRTSTPPRLLHPCRLLGGGDPGTLAESSPHPGWPHGAASSVAPGRSALVGAASLALQAMLVLVLWLQGLCLSMELGPVLLGLRKLPGESRTRHSVGADDGGVRGRRSPRWRRRDCSLPCSRGVPPGENPSSGRPRPPPAAAACRRVLPVGVVMEEPSASAPMLYNGPPLSPSPDGCMSLLLGNVC